MKWLSRRAVCATLWLMLASLCWAGSAGAFASLKLSEATDVISYRDPSGTTSFGSVSHLRAVMRGDFGGEATNATVTAWTQTLSSSVSVKELASSASVDILWFDGSASSVWDLPIVSGMMPGAGETTGCAVDYRTALKLYGSTNIIGKPVTVGGREYAIRAVFRLPEGIGALGSDTGRGLIYCPAASGADSLRITAYEFFVPAGGAVEAGEATRGWLTSAGMRAPSTVYRRSEERQLLRLLVQLPGLLLMLFAAFELVRAGFGLGRASLRFARESLKNLLLSARVGWTIAAAGLAGVAAAGALIAMVLGVMPVNLHVPPSYIPTQWSDLSFWPGLVTAASKDYALRQFAVAFRPDITRDAMTAWATVLGVLAVAALLPARRALKQSVTRGKLPPYFLPCVLAVCAAPPLAVMLVRWLGWTPDTVMGMSSLPVMFVLSFVMLRAYPPALTLPIRAFRYARKQKPRVKKEMTAPQAIRPRGGGANP